MGNQKRNVADEIVEGLRQIIEDMDRLLNPEKRQKRAPVPVPARVRPDRREEPRNIPYR